MAVMMNNVVVELVKAGAAPLGWGFAVAGAGNVDQEQRWLFVKPSMEELRKALPPRGDVQWSTNLSSSSPFNAVQSLADFKNVVLQQWGTGGNHVYAKVNASVTSFDPQNPDLPTNPTFPPYPSPEPSYNDQFDVGTIQGVQNNNLLAYGAARWPNTQQAREMWVLKDGFDVSAVTVFKGAEFSTFTKVMNEKIWAQGDELVLASVNYHLDPLSLGDL